MECPFVIIITELYITCLAAIKLHFARIYLFPKYAPCYEWEQISGLKQLSPPCKVNGEPSRFQSLWKSPNAIPCYSTDVLSVVTPSFRKSKSKISSFKKSIKFCELHTIDAIMLIYFIICKFDFLQVRNKTTWTGNMVLWQSAGAGILAHCGMLLMYTLQEGRQCLSIPQGVSF